MSGRVWMSFALVCSLGLEREGAIVEIVTRAEVWEGFVPLLRAAGRAVSSKAEPGTPVEQWL